MESPYPKLKRINRLPSPPGVAMQILRLVDSEDSSIEELTEVISTDPALTSKVLKFMSSPVVGAGYEGTTLAEAISRIGMRGAKMMALSFSLVSEDKHRVCPSFSFPQFWSLSLARAVAARALAQAGVKWNPEEAFVTALVSEIGKLVYATGMPNHYEPVLSGKVRPELSLSEREHEVLGADRFEIGMCLLKDWQLPEPVWRAVGALRVDSESDGEPSVRVLRVAQRIAEFICDKDQHTGEALEELTLFATDTVEIDADTFRALLDSVSKDWVGYGQLLLGTTENPPDMTEIEKEAEEHRTALRLATEIEVKSLRSENEQLSHLARRDRLTGLFNRGAFDAALVESIDEMEKKGGSVALLMIDADHFKAVNDQHGHPAGDAILRHLARVISDNVRRRDEVFRYGGEEFSVIARELTLEAAETLAENIRSAIQSTPCIEGGVKLPVTVSIGIGRASWPDEPTDEESLLKYADDRLYDAKRDGRNRCKSRPLEESSRGVFSRIGRLFAKAKQEAGNR